MFILNNLVKDFDNTNFIRVLFLAAVIKNNIHSLVKHKNK
jgi:hypothetical protein